MTLKRAEMIEAIKQDYPHIPEFFINQTVLMYEKNPEWFKENMKLSEKIKKKGKTQPNKEIKTQYVGSVEILDGSHASAKALKTNEAPPAVANKENPIMVEFN